MQKDPCLEKCEKVVGFFGELHALFDKYQATVEITSSGVDDSDQLLVCVDGKYAGQSMGGIYPSDIAAMGRAAAAHLADTMKKPT